MNNTSTNINKIESEHVITREELDKLKQFITVINRPIPFPPRRSEEELIRLMDEAFLRNDAETFMKLSDERFRNYPEFHCQSLYDWSPYGSQF